MVMVTMVDGKFTQIFPAELARTSATDPGVQLECPFAIAIFPLAPFMMGPSNNLVQLVF